MKIWAPLREGEIVVIVVKFLSCPPPLIFGPRGDPFP